MKVIFYIVIFFVTSTGPAFAKPNKMVDLGFEVGHRIDQLNWSIAGTNGTPNILSELSWEGLKILQIRVNAKLLIETPSSPYSLFIRTNVSYGEIHQGENQDSDYDGNNRTLEFSRSNNSADQGNVLDNSLGFGLQFTKKMAQTGHVFRIAPLVGYSYHQQNLRMTDGLQTINTNNPINLPRAFSGLNNTYKTEWRGPWVGLDLSTDIHPQHTVSISMEYHWARYDAEANWNLRPDFAHPVSFVHFADGTGLNVSLAWAKRLFTNCTITVKADYLDWKTKAGTDLVFFSDGTTARAQLNRVNWESQAFSLGLQYRF